MNKLNKLLSSILIIAIFITSLSGTSYANAVASGTAQNLSKSNAAT